MSLKIYSWNVNGIRAVIKKGSLQTFLGTHQPDILCLQETKANESQVTLDLPEYYQYWNSAEKAGYSGTAIFTKLKPHSVILGFDNDIVSTYNLANDPYGDPSREGRVLSVEFADFWIVTVYTPNTKDDLSRLHLRHAQWDPAFREHLARLRQHKPVLFSGDLNVAHREIDLANPKGNRGKHGFTDEERAGFDAFETAGFVDTFRARHPQEEHAYTWWSHFANARSRNIGWRIDYWLASRDIADRVIDASIHPDVLGSDHCPVSIEVVE